MDKFTNMAVVFYNSTAVDNATTSYFNAGIDYNAFTYENALMRYSSQRENGCAIHDSWYDKTDLLKQFMKHDTFSRVTDTAHRDKRRAVPFYE